VASQFTRRVVPNATVNGAVGSGCSRAFLGQHLHRCPSGLPVRARVDLLAPGPAGGFELAEHPILGRKVGLGRDQVGLGDPDRCLAAALGLRIRRHTGADGHAVVPGDRDDLRMPDRDPGDVIDRDGALVVGLLCPAPLCGRQRSLGALMLVNGWALLATAT
jgi:hypothetical protein